MSNEDLVERLREYAGDENRMTRQDRLCVEAARAIGELLIDRRELMLDLDKVLMDHRSTIEDIEAESSRDDPDSVG